MTRPRLTVSAWVIGGLILVALGVVFALPHDRLLCARGTDMTGEFVAWRAYLAANLGAGHIPLWNPYTYGGQPFLAGLESAVWYPPNLLFVIMPLGPALNFSVLLHLIILGWGMERWASQRGLDPRAAALAGLVAPLSGAVFPHVYAGHLSNLCTMAWAPWIFRALERAARPGARRDWLWIGGWVCLQILGGHVQYVFYTAIAAGIQVAVLACTGSDPRVRWRAAFTLLLGYAAALPLAAAQLLPTLAAAGESLRGQKLDRDFAAMFGFPPENFLTLLAPGFFGSLGQPVYWGRCYLWEMSLFIGTAGLVLIVLALVNPSRRRQGWQDVAVAAPLLVLALGVHTPLFGLLYHFAPGFGHFRAWSKFTFPATLFLIMILAAGADLLLRGEAPGRRIARISVVAGGVLALAGGALFLEPAALAFALGAVQASRESYLPDDVFTQPFFGNDAGVHAGLSLALAGTVLFTAGLLMMAPRRTLFLRWSVPALVAMEMIGFAAGQVTTAHLSDTSPDNLQQFAAANPGDYRVLNLRGDNNGYLIGVREAWGNNPTVLRRYAEFVWFAMGADPAKATQYLPTPTRRSPLFSLVRLRYLSLPYRGDFMPIDPEQPRLPPGILSSGTPPLPHVLLVPEFRMPGGRDAIFAAMRDPAFDPTRTVFLETAPAPVPDPDARGSARLVEAQPDALTIEADTDRPALLLITDLYTHDWHAEALTGSVQSHYDILPADYILRAIPLQAGHHRLQVVYAPAIFPWGVAVSVLAWAAWLALVIMPRAIGKRRDL